MSSIHLHVIVAGKTKLQLEITSTIKRSGRLSPTTNERVKRTKMAEEDRCRWLLHYCIFNYPH